MKRWEWIGLGAIGLVVFYWWWRKSQTPAPSSNLHPTVQGQPPAAVTSGIGHSNTPMSTPNIGEISADWTGVSQSVAGWSVLQGGVDVSQ